jgi:hypothetical protein
MPKRVHESPEPPRKLSTAGHPGTPGISAYDGGLWMAAYGVIERRIHSKA